ncbi:MAG: PilZ domain-containing protein [Methylococcales bacterium]|nr:PilZ domain-containing protein [Methylococcales bacterium]
MPDSHSRRPTLNLYKEIHSKSDGKGSPKTKRPDIKPLYMNYMSFITDGGFFIPTKRPHKMGAKIEINLVLTEDVRKFIPLSGRVVWITPEGCNNRVMGVGIQLNNDDEGRIKKEIEITLAPTLKYDAATNTM